MAEQAIAEQPKPRRSISIFPIRWHTARAVRNDWVVNTELGTTPEDLLQPSFWAHVAEQMTPYDHIEARVDDGEWMAELVVLSCDRNWARVKMLHLHKLSTDVATPQQSILHEVKWKGPQLKFAVVRLSDGQTIKAGCDTRGEANAWMAEHERTVTR